MSVTPAVQWILPAIHCAAKDGSGSLTIECRIQKSRNPRIDNVIGIWNATTTYNSSSDSHDVVYYNGSSYPGWRCILTNVNQAPPANMAAWWASGSSYWEPASNFDFVQGDFTKVFYLDQQIIKKDGLGSFVRSVSRQQGLITPDSRQFMFLDYSVYSGAWGVTTSPYVVGSNIGQTDLSATNYRTLLPLIFNDPDAFYTVFFSRVTGKGYNTNRELYNIGDIDFAKLTAEYDLDWMPGTSSALQKLSGKVQAECVLNRLNTFTVYDLLSTIALSDLDAGATAQCFIGGNVLLGNVEPPTFPQFGNRYYVANYTTTDNSVEGIPGILSYFHSRANSRIFGISPVVVGSFIHGTLQNALIVATTSINDNLHFIKLTTILSKIAALVNFSWNSSTDLNSNLAFWSDIVDQTTGILSSANIALTNIGVCFEYFFNIDPRCGAAVTGSGPTAVTEMSMGGVSWNTTVGDMLMKLCRSLIAFVKSDYDQINWRPENILTDAIAPTSNPLPSHWETSKGGIKPRVQSTLYVAVNHTGDSDIKICPRKRESPPLKVEMALRVKKHGLLITTVGDSTVDLIQNSNLSAANQWKTFSPMSGGIFDGGHVGGTGGTATIGTFNTVGLPSGGGGVNSGSYGTFLFLKDSSREFVLVQGMHGNLWGFSPDIYTRNTNYLKGNDEQYGLSDSVCFANGSYAAIVDKITRSTLLAMFPNALPTGIPDPPHSTAYPTFSSGVPYVIGYNGFGTDLTVCKSGSDQTATAAGTSSLFVTSKNCDFYNFDCKGNTLLGQQIIIPGRGDFVIKNIFSNGSSNSNSSGSFVAILQLDRPVNSGTSLEFRIGGPTMNPDSFMIGTYFYYYNTADLRFGSGYYRADASDGTVDGFFPSMFLGSGSDSSSGASGWNGCYALSRLRYADGTVYDIADGAPDDTYGTALKTFAQCQAALNLGSFQLITRNFGNVLSNSGSMLGYGPLDTYSEWSQGQQQNYKVQTLAINERAGGIIAELLSTTNALPINDANYPVTDGSANSAGAGASGSSGGGASGGGSTVSGITWAANAGSIALSTGVNVDVPVTGITELVLSAISGTSSITGFFDASKQARAGLTVINQTGYTVTLKNLTSGSLQEVLTGTGNDLIIPTGACVVLNYAPVDGYWHVIGAINGSANLTISANKNDYALVPFGSYVYFIDVTGNYVLTGISSGVNGLSITIVNVGTGILELSNNDAASLAANRLQILNSIYLSQYMSIQLVYNSSFAKWLNAA